MLDSAVKKLKLDCHKQSEWFTLLLSLLLSVNLSLIDWLLFLSLLFTNMSLIDWNMNQVSYNINKFASVMMGGKKNAYNILVGKRE
jgi:hypothetical protein